MWAQVRQRERDPSCSAVIVLTDPSAMLGLQMLDFIFLYGVTMLGAILWLGVSPLALAVCTVACSFSTTFLWAADVLIQRASKHQPGESQEMQNRSTRTPHTPSKQLRSRQRHHPRAWAQMLATKASKKAPWTATKQVLSHLRPLVVCLILGLFVGGLLRLAVDAELLYSLQPLPGTLGAHFSIQLWQSTTAASRSDEMPVQSAGAFISDVTHNTSQPSYFMNAWGIPNNQPSGHQHNGDDDKPEFNPTSRRLRGNRPTGRSGPRMSAGDVARGITSLYSRWRRALPDLLLDVYIVLSCLLHLLPLIVAGRPLPKHMCRVCGVDIVVLAKLVLAAQLLMHHVFLAVARAAPPLAETTAAFLERHASRCCQ